MCTKQFSGADIADEEYDKPSEGFHQRRHLFKDVEARAKATKSSIENIEIGTQLFQNADFSAYVLTDSSRTMVLKQTQLALTRGYFVQFSYGKEHKKERQRGFRQTLSCLERYRDFRRAVEKRLRILKLSLPQTNEG